MPERTYRERLRANTLLVAKRIVANEGLTALQARRVAVDAGCSVGTIYNLYDGLDDLIINVNAATLEDLGQILMAEKDRAPTAELSAQMTSLALAYLSFALDQQPSWRAVFEHQLAKNRTVPDWYRERQSALFAIVEDLLTRYVADPNERSSIARALFSAVHGIVALALDQKLGDFDRNATESQIRFVVNAAAVALRRPDNAPTAP